MTDMTDDLVENLRQPSQWLRIVFMLGFFFVLWATGLIMVLLVVGQALFSVCTGRDNDNLRSLGATLTSYVNQVLQFLTYNRETKPFPFDSFPDRDIEDNEAEPGAPKSSDVVESEAEPEADAEFDSDQPKS